MNLSPSQQHLGGQREQLFPFPSSLSCPFVPHRTLSVSLDSRLLAGREGRPEPPWVSLSGLGCLSGGCDLFAYLMIQSSRYLDSGFAPRQSLQNQVFVIPELAKSLAKNWGFLLRPRQTPSLFWFYFMLYSCQPPLARGDILERANFTGKAEEKPLCWRL